MRPLKASRRIINPNDDDYQTDSEGVKHLLGPFTFDIRNRYVQVAIDMYLARFPAQTHKQAMNIATQKWRIIVLKAIQDRKANFKPGPPPEPEERKF